MVTLILSAICGLSGLALLFAAYRVATYDRVTYTSRERFFATFFRGFWVVACILGALCLFRAAWFVWVQPFQAAIMLFVLPLLVLLLVAVARWLLPYLYRRRFRRK